MNRCIYSIGTPEKCNVAGLTKHKPVYCGDNQDHILG